MSMSFGCAKNWKKIRSHPSIFLQREGKAIGSPHRTAGCAANPKSEVENPNKGSLVAKHRCPIAAKIQGFLHDCSQSFWCLSLRISFGFRPPSAVRLTRVHSFCIGFHVDLYSFTPSSATEEGTFKLRISKSVWRAGGSPHEVTGGGAGKLFALLSRSRFYSQ